MKHGVNQTETGMKSGLSNARILRWTGLCLTASTLYVGHAMAANGTWTNDVSGSWTNTLNWAEGIVPGGADTDAIAFTNDITADRTVTLDGNRIVNSVTIGDADTNSAAGWTLSPGTGGGLTLAGITPTLIVNTLATNKVVTLGAILSGSNGLTKAGAGTLTLTATNAYSGNTVISNGVLKLQKNLLPYNLVALYRFNSSASDDIAGSQKLGAYNGQTYSGTANGTVSLSTDHPANGSTHSLFLNGGYIDLPATLSSINPFRGSGTIGGVAGGDYTITCWFKTSGSNPIILSSARDNTGSNHSMAFYIDTGANLGGGKLVTDNYFINQQNAGSSENNGAWHFGVVTYQRSANTFHVIVDGTDSGAKAFDPAIPNAQNDTIRIGGSRNTTFPSAGTFIGYLSDVAIFAGVLSGAELTKVQNGDFSSFLGEDNPILPTNTPLSLAAGATLDLGITAQPVGSLAAVAGASVLNNGTLTVGGDNSSQAFAGSISGTGAFIKTGAGTQTLSGANTFTGATTVKEGKLTVLNSKLTSGSEVVAAGATLEYAVTAGQQDQLKTDLAGAGTLLKTGAGVLTFGNASGSTINWSFAPGAWIDVREGTLIGGMWASDLWTGNHASLSVSNGAAFRGMEANVRVAKLTGSGTVKTGYLTYAGGYQSFTVGVDGESSTFDGTLVNDDTGGTVGALTKTGAGTQTLTGSSSYTGHTTVDGGTLKVTGKLYANGNDSSTIVTVRNGGVLELDTWGYGAGASLGLFATDAARLLVSNGTIRVNGSSLAAGRGATIQAGGATLEATSNALFSVCDAGAPWVFTGNPTLTLAGAGTGTFEMGFASSGALVKAGTGKWTLAGTNAYSGSVQVQSGTLQVMADVPTNTPAPGAAMWLDATKGVTLASGKVTVWADQSGNGRNATNIWNSGPTVTTDINGLPTLRFTRSSSQFLGTGGLGGVSNLTLFIVHKDASINSYQTFIGTDGAWRNDTTNGLSVHLIASDGAHPLNYAVFNNNGFGTASMVAGTAQIDEIVDSSGPWQLFLNGAANGSASRATVLKNLNAFRIGSWDASRYLDSSIGEILIYTNVLNAAERQATYAYLNSKWFNPARYGIIQCASSNLLDTSATVTVAAGASLDLAGKSQTITSLSGGGLVTNGTLTVNNGTITPGGSNTVGTLTLAVTATLNGTLRVDIGAAGACDRLVVAGALDLSGLTLVMENPGLLDKDRIYTIATCTGSLTGSFSSTPNLPASWKVRTNRTTGAVELIYLRGTMISFF